MLLGVLEEIRLHKSEPGTVNLTYKGTGNKAMRDYMTLVYKFKDVPTS